MIDSNMKELMANALFTADDFEQIWMELNQLNEALKFEDYWDDEERIKEYKYVTQQLRKYMASKRNEVLEKTTLQDMVAYVEDLITKQREYGDTRQDILYNFMRDHWLVQLYNILSQMAAADETTEEE